MRGHGRSGHDVSGPEGHGAAVIRARGLGKRFGDKRVLEGIDLDVDRGDFLLVTGPNGSGKTTLLRLCAGLAVPTAGTLDVTAPREIAACLKSLGAENIWVARGGNGVEARCRRPLPT